MDCVPRNYGTGRVFQRNQTWWIAYSISGQEQRESARTKSKNEAQRLLRERLRQVDLGYAPTKATVGDLLDLFIADQRNRERKWASKSIDRAEVLRILIGKRKAMKVTGAHVAHLIRQLREKRKIAGPTINRFRAVLMRAYRLGVENGIPATAPHWPRMAESAPRRDPVSREVYERIRDAMYEPYRTAVIAGYWTACRRGEILAWRWDQIDPEKGLVLIPTSKTDQPRVVPLADELKDALAARLEFAEQEIPDCPWVFTIDGENPVNENSFNSAWRRKREQIGEPKLRFHALRHTALTNMRAADVEEGAAMAISGHKTRHTFDRYGIQPEQALIDAIQRTQEKMNGQPTKPIRTKNGQSKAKKRTAA